ncbi:DNA-binding protein [Paenibacillus sp. FSL M7-0802]|uniref:DNA-binding protein n=1 Tax=Paenibacillus sp. FSL M7-0802 TaxID=2921536 RepID=UPI0030F99FB8
MSIELDTYIEEKQANSTYIENEILKSLESYPPLLNVKHIQEIMQIGKAAAYTVLNSGEFPTLKIVNQLRVARPYFAKYLIESSTYKDA